METRVEKVCARQCKHCLFGPDPVPGADIAATWVQRLRAAAARAVARKRARPDVGSGAAFFCHKQQEHGAPGVVCRGWWERRWEFGWDAEAEARDAPRVQFVPVPTAVRRGEMDWVAEHDPFLRRQYQFKVFEDEEGGAPGGDP